MARTKKAENVVEEIKEASEELKIVNTENVTEVIEKASQDETDDVKSVLTDTEIEADNNAEQARKEMSDNSVTFAGPKNGIIWYQGKASIVFVNGRYTTQNKTIIDFMDKKGYKVVIE